MKKPTCKIKAHGAVNPIEILDFESTHWPHYGVTIGRSTEKHAAFYSTKDMRKVAEFLIKAADYIDHKESL